MKKNLHLLFFSCFLATLTYNTVLATPPTSVTWKGGTQTMLGGFRIYDWGTAANWVGGVVPIATDNVVIPSSVGGVPIIHTTVARSGTTTVTLSIGITDGGTLNNSGAMSMSAGSGGITIDGTGVLNNNSGGTISLDGSVPPSLYTTGTTNPSINNKSGAAITLNNGAYIQIPMSTFMTNAGTINLNSGSRLWLQDGGMLNNTGVIMNSAGIISGHGGIFSGTLYTNPSGATIDETFANFGEYSCLTFSNNLTNNGVIFFELSGATACAQYDQIAVTNVMTFGGTFTAGGTVASGTYTLMTYGSRIGTFTNSVAQLGATGKYLHIKSVNYTANVLIGTVDNSALPIELLSFTAKAEGAKNNLYWVTASEKDNAFFDVERSLNGKNFSSIGQVKGANKPSSYEWIDDAPFGITYYRLRQVDFDGAETYSKIVSVAQKGGKGFQLYPTLVVNGILTVAAPSANTGGPEGFDYAVFNLLGQAVQTGKTTSQVDVSALPAGTYILKAGADQAKFVKE